MRTDIRVAEEAKSTILDVPLHTHNLHLHLETRPRTRITREWAFYRLIFASLLTLLSGIEIGISNPTLGRHKYKVGSAVGRLFNIYHALATVLDKHHGESWSAAPTALGGTGL